MSLSAAGLVRAEALRLLKKHVHPDAAECDVLLFGTEAEVASPLPLKYSIDNIRDRIYNISKDVELNGSRYFEEVRLSGGYIEFTVGDGGFAELAEVFRGAHPAVGAMADRFEIGSAGYVHARLLHTVNTAGGDFLLPSSVLARRALWLCITAETKQSRSLALRACAAALDEHRRLGTLSAAAAAVMASAIAEMV